MLRLPNLTGAMGCVAETHRAGQVKCRVFVVRHEKRRAQSNRLLPLREWLPGQRRRQNEATTRTCLLNGGCKASGDGFHALQFPVCFPFELARHRQRSPAEERDAPQPGARHAIEHRCLGLLGDTATDEATLCDAGLPRRLQHQMVCEPRPGGPCPNLQAHSYQSQHCGQT